MAGNSKTSEKFEKLREEAEKKLDKAIEETGRIPQEEAPSIKELIHELQVHQIELELQNEELQKTKNQLQKTKNKYSNLYNSAPISYLTLNEDGEILDANRTAAEKLHTKQEKIKEKTLYDYIKKEDKDELYKHLRKVFKTKQRQKCELKIEKTQKTPKIEFHASLESTTTKNNQDKTICRTVLRDVTQRKKTAERKDFLHSLLRHDIRNKTQIILGYLEILEDYELPKELKNYVSKARKATKEGIEIIEKVKTLKGIEKERETKEVDLNSVLKEVVNETEEQAKEKGIKIKSPNCDCKVKAGALLNELFYNIIENSIKHSKGNTIRIKTKQKENKCTITIEDDGKGIPNEQKNKIFKKGTKNGETAGSGLGMYLTKQITKNYNGTIKTKNSELGGAKFEITLKKA